MIPALLIVIPLLTGVIALFFKNEGAAKTWALVSSLASLVVTLLAFTAHDKASSLFFNADWMPLLGSNFSVGLDGMGKVLCLLTAIAFPIIFVSTWRREYASPGRFFGLMLLSQAGLMGVFVAYDALLFYFFWELALIPAYFLCSQWGGERRIQVTFKFFIYTFVGSLFMLLAIIYLYFRTPDQSFALESFYKIKLGTQEQMWLFWVMFVAFMVKMPIFPLHTWQPDTYEQSPTAVTMVLSGVMVKMGVFGLIRWLIPIIPAGAWAWGDTVSSLAVIGMIYASLVAMRQDDLKRLVAYSSIAHVGLMCLAVFASETMGMQGVMIQMFNHGINIIALWIVVELIESQFGTRKMSELGGIAQKAPALSILLVIVSLANVALPLTNAFVGEFLMFSGVYNSDVSQYSKVFTVAAIVTVILSAVYTFNMLQKVLFGSTSAITEKGRDIRFNEKFALVLLVAVILLIGVYPKPMLEVTQSTVDTIISKMFLKHP
jgi:NADH-quinone oxidoreductase subunit M